MLDLTSTPPPPPPVAPSITMCPTLFHPSLKINYYICWCFSGVKEAGSLMILASEASTTIADVAGAAPGGLRWMQTYIFKNRKHTEHIVRQAERAGFKAIVLTVDSPVTVNWDDLDDSFLAEGHCKTDPKYR